jgi:hypothetical protein
MKRLGLLRLFVGICIVLVMVCSLVAIVAAPAIAATVIMCNPQQGPVGTSVQIAATGFAPSAILTARFDGAVVTTAPTTVTTNTFGDAAFAIAIPVATAGAHTISVTDGVNTAATIFTVLQKVTVSPAEGPVGTTITVNGTGFSGAGVTANVTIGGMTFVSSVPVDDTGSFTATGVVPSLPSGNKVVSATDGAGNVADVTATFKVTPTLILTPDTGMAGSLITVSGSNWAPGSVSMTLAGYSWLVIAAEPDGTIWAPNCQIPVQVTPGIVAVAGVDGSGNTALTTFTVVARLLTLTPSSGPRGTQVLVTGSNMTLNGTIPAGSLFFKDMAWNVAAIPIDSSGTMYPTTLAVPLGAPMGANLVVAFDSGGLISVGTWTVTKPLLSVEPNTGPANSSATITGSGWLPGATVTITFNYINTSCVAAGIQFNAIPDANGNISAALTIPVDAHHSIDTITASDVNNNTADAVTFTVPPAAIAISPIEGPVGTEITINGTGFALYSPILIKIGSDVISVTPMADNIGQFQFDAIVPSMPTGPQIVSATDGIQTATAFFNVLAMPTHTPIAGITREVDGNILPGVSITLDGVETVVSDQYGNYVIEVYSTGSHTLVVHKDGFRDMTRTVNIAGLGEGYAMTCNFQGQYGLIPNAPDMWYALDCVNLWLYPPNPDTGLDMWTALDVVNAWLYPITE